MPTELGLLTIRFRDTGSLSLPGKQEAFLVVRLSCFVVTRKAEGEREHQERERATGLLRRSDPQATTMTTSNPLEFYYHAALILMLDVHRSIFHVVR